MSMGVYSTAFRLAMARELMYRANFVFGRLRALVIFCALIFVFRVFGQHTTLYTQQELSTYVILAGAMYMVFFVYTMDSIANEIVDGDLINYLLRPIHYFFYWFCRIGAMRALNILAAVAGLAFIIIATSSSFLFQSDAYALIQFAVLLVGALAIITLIDFLAGCLSFWTYRSFGPRFLAMIGIQFMSGAYSPLDLFPHWIQAIYFTTPFPSIVFVPISAYLGRMQVSEFLGALGMQLAWICILGMLLILLWKRGIRTYEAIGR